MSIIKGINSNVSMSEADEYFSTRVDSAVWFETAHAGRKAALVSSTGILDELRWAGVAADPAQDLAFPRKGHYFDPRIGMNVALEGYPKRVKVATYELALHLLSNEGSTNSTGEIDILKISGIELHDIKAPPRMPPSVTRMIKPLLVNAGAATWWRAN